MVANFSKQSFAYFIVVAFALIISNQAMALTQLSASVDKSPALVNESILLTVVADDDVSRGALDTSVLMKDFIVGQTSVSSHTSMVNFETSKQTIWKIVLIARNTGKFTIPALTINGVSTAPISLIVVPQSNNSKAKQADIFLTSELSKDTVYVQQLLTLTLKLHFAVDLKSGSITEPEFPGASVEKIGKDSQQDTLINGKRYRVIEQKYAITPEKSGEFTLAAPIFSGEIIQGGQRRSSFMSFSQSKPFSIAGKALKLIVLPTPANYPSDKDWLPTDILTLHQELQPANGEFVVGDPITRTVTLTASSLSETQLPELMMQSSNGLKIYPDQAETHSRFNKGRLVSQKIQNFAIVPSTPGSFVLPEMTVTWFNVVTNKIEQAKLPSQKITVIAAENTHGANAVSPIPQSATFDGQQSAAPSTQPMQPATQVTTVVKTDNRILWLLAGLWIMTLVAWYLHVNKLKKSPKQNVINHDNANGKSANHALAQLSADKIYKQLVKACKENNATQASALLLPWLKKQFTHNINQGMTKTLSQATNQLQRVISAHSLTSFNEAVIQLEQSLYGATSEDAWHGKSLLTVIDALKNEDKKSVGTNSGFSLNP